MKLQQLNNAITSCNYLSKNNKDEAYEIPWLTMPSLAFEVTSLFGGRAEDRGFVQNCG